MTMATTKKLETNRISQKRRPAVKRRAGFAATVQQVRQGFPYSRLAKFQKHLDLPWEKVSMLVQIPMRTLVRRQAQGRLHSDESDRLLRVSTLFQKAVDLFEGDVAGARRWWQTPLPALAGETPMEMASTEVGAREVENLIIRLEHGVFS